MGFYKHEIVPSKSERQLLSHYRRMQGCSFFLNLSGHPVSSHLVEVGRLIEFCLKLAETSHYFETNTPRQEQYCWSTIGRPRLSRTVFSFIIFLK